MCIDIISVHMAIWGVLVVQALQINTCMLSQEKKTLQIILIKVILLVELDDITSQLLLELDACSVTTSSVYMQCPPWKNRIVETHWKFWRVELCFFTLVFIVLVKPVLYHIYHLDPCQ